MTDCNRWFIEEVQPHEPSLRAYLRSRFSSITDFDDLVQETYARILNAYRNGSAITSAKAMLFTLAKNAALDIFRREKLVKIEYRDNIEQFTYGANRETSTTEFISHNQEIKILREALDSLPKRCREVMILRMIHEFTHKEIALKLKISSITVNNQLTIGVERCRKYLHAKGVGVLQ